MHSRALSHKKTFWLVIGLAIFLRLWNLNLPFVEPYNSMTRQSMVAEIARNFYEHDFNFDFIDINISLIVGLLLIS